MPYYSVKVKYKGHEVFARGDPRIFLDYNYEIKLHNIKSIRLLKFEDQKEF